MCTHRKFFLNVAKPLCNAALDSKSRTCYSTWFRPLTYYYYVFHLPKSAHEILQEHSHDFANFCSRVFKQRVHLLRTCRKRAQIDGNGVPSLLQQSVFVFFHFFHFYSDVFLFIAFFPLRLLHLLLLGCHFRRGWMHGCSRAVSLQ